MRCRNAILRDVINTAVLSYVGPSAVRRAFASKHEMDELAGRSTTNLRARA
jgi:hypothetical protein